MPLVPSSSIAHRGTTRALTGAAPKQCRFAGAQGDCDETETDAHWPGRRRRRARATWAGVRSLPMYPADALDAPEKVTSLDIDHGEMATVRPRLKEFKNVDTLGLVDADIARVPPEIAGLK